MNIIIAEEYIIKLKLFANSDMYSDKSARKAECIIIYRYASRHTLYTAQRWRKRRRRRSRRRAARAITIHL